MAMGSISQPGWSLCLKPGGICISGSAYDQVENKLGLDMNTLESIRLKILPGRYGYIGCCPIRGQLRIESFKRKKL